VFNTPAVVFFDPGGNGRNQFKVLRTNASSRLTRYTTLYPIIHTKTYL
jgi:hypothetical protein